MATSINQALGTIVGLALMTGCTTNEKRFRQAAESGVASSTGATVKWLRTDADINAVREEVRSLLSAELNADGAVKIALLNNRALQIELEEIGITHSDLIQAGLLANPTFSASVRFPDRPPSAANTDYSLTGELLDLIFMPYRKRLAVQDVERGQMRLADAVLSLAHEVRVAYYEIVAEQQLSARLKLIEEVNEAAADLAKRQHEAGNIPDLEFTNHLATYSRSKVRLANSERELRRHRQKFNRLLGLWGVDTEWSVPSQLPAIPEREVEFDELESMAIRQRQDLAALKQQTDTLAAAAALKRRTRFSPAAIEIGVEHEKESEGTRLTGPSIAIGLPLFDQGQGALLRLASEQRIAERALEERAIEIRAAINAAIDDVITSRDLARYYGSVVLPQQTRILNETLLQYNAMQTSTYELLMSKELQVETEREYVESWRDYWIAKADLDRAVGGRLTFNESSPAPANDKTDASQTTDHKH